MSREESTSLCDLKEGVKRDPLFSSSLGDHTNIIKELEYRLDSISTDLKVCHKRKEKFSGVSAH